MNRTYKDYRIDFVKIENGKTKYHLKHYYEEMQDAVDAAYEGRRDGFKTWLLEHVFDGYYNVLCELK